MPFLHYDEMGQVTGIHLTEDALSVEISRDQITELQDDQLAGIRWRVDGGQVVKIPAPVASPDERRAVFFAVANTLLEKTVRDMRWRDWGDVRDADSLTPADLTDHPEWLSWSVEAHGLIVWKGTIWNALEALTDDDLLHIDPVQWAAEIPGPITA